MPWIHSLSDVQSTKIGEDTSIWQFCVVLPGAQIGAGCNICAQVFIENNVIIGNYVTIKPGVQIWDGIVLEDYVFVGPNVTFTNDRVPRSRSKEWTLTTTTIKKGASIGANATLVAGLTIGSYALIGAGSVVTKDVSAHSVWYGNPAIQKGYITCKGILLDMDKKDKEGIEHNIDE